MGHGCRDHGASRTERGRGPRRLTWVATGLSALAMTDVWAGLAMTGNGTSLRGGGADVAIQGITAAPGQAAHLPWIATGLPALAMTVWFVIAR